MNLEFMDEFCERGILYVVLAILVSGPLLCGATGIFGFLVLEGLTLVVMLLWTIRIWATRSLKLLWPPIYWTVLAFALYAVIRYRGADVEYIARIELSRVLVYTFLFLAIVNNLHRQEHMQLIVHTMLFLAMAIALYAVYQFVTNSDKVWWYVKPYEHRGSGTFISPNNLAGFLEMLLPLGLAILLTSRARALAKVFVGYASLAILAGIAVSLSKGGWLATAFSLTLLFAILLLHRTHRLPSIIVLALIAIVGFVIIPRTPLFQERLKQYVSKQGQVNDDMRFALWHPAYELWQENPWLGVGPGLFNTRFPAHRPEGVQLQPDRVHNDYLNTLTDWGIVGAAIVAAALGCLFWGVAKTWPFVRGTSSDLGMKRSNKFALLLGATLGLLALMVHEVVDFNMHVPANAILAITLMAILTSCLRFATESFWFTAKVWMKAALSVMLLAGLVYLSWQWERRTREWVWLEKSDTAESMSTNQVVALEGAFQVEPQNSQTAFDIGNIYCARMSLADDNMLDYATNTLVWQAKSMAINPYEAKSWMEYGRALDTLDRTTEASYYFDRAARCDPSSYYISDYVGLHCMNLGDYPAARAWFKRSSDLEWRDNPIAASYLEIVRQRMLEDAVESAAGGLKARLR